MKNNRIMLCGKTVPEICEANKITNTVRWIHPDRVMPCHVFLLILDGAFRVEEEGVEYVLQKNDVFFLKSGLHHTSRLYSDDGTSWYFVHFYDNLCPGCDVSACPLSLQSATARIDQFELPKLMHLSPYDAEQLGLQIQEMIGHYASISPVARAMQNTELKKLLLQLVELNNSASGQSSDGLITKITNAIKASAFEKYDSAQIARQLGLSYEYLSRVFSKATGMTISHYKNYVRIQKAIDLLRLGTMNINEIAQRTGFENQFYFSRVFKNITGLSPTQYVKNIYVQHSDFLPDDQTNTD